MEEDALPMNLEYTGEFGPELVLFLPFVTWLSKVGWLRSRKIITYTGMRCFYKSLDCLAIIEKPETRYYVPPFRRPDWLPVKNEHDFDGNGENPFHLYPDLRSLFQSDKRIERFMPTSKPILVVHNKYHIEWDFGPVNHIPIDTLEYIFQELSRYFNIVYIRHGIKVLPLNYSADHIEAQVFDDLSVLLRYPEVTLFDDLYSSYSNSYGPAEINQVKSELYASCYHYITSQGGGAHQIALLSGSLISILHRRGQEEHWAYGKGYYGFMARIPPVCMVSRHEKELEGSVVAFKDAYQIDGRVFVDPRAASLLTSLSPSRIAERRWSVEYEMLHP